MSEYKQETIRGNIKYFSSTTLKELFSDVDARCILDFTKESGFYRII